jgi:Ni/Co efflux regulator RcnB
LGKSGKPALGIVEMTGPDVRMDQFGNADRPANPLPVKCPHCTMPDLDFVAKPYLLAKGFAAPAETSLAEVGNFLVRERTRKILELVAPGACTFHPTAEKKSKKATPWFLAVPANVVAVPGMPEHDEKRERCKKCNEPKLGYRSYANGQHIVRKAGVTAPVDIFKVKQWFAPHTAEDSLAGVNAYRKKHGVEPLDWSAYDLTPPPHPQRWTRDQLDRDLYFSVRLEQLLKKAKVKGQLVRLLVFEDVKPTVEDLAWIDEKMALLAKHKLVDGAAATSGKAAKSKKPSDSPVAKWFQQYLKKNAAKKQPAKIDIAAIEKKQKLALPQDYKDFIATVGPKSFEDVMEQEGFAANVLPPSKIDFRDFRRGKMKDQLGDEESLAVDGVMFADTDHGDAFVFDVSQRDASGNYPIYWHDHEGNVLEPFAPNFAACIKRFATKT